MALTLARALSVFLSLAALHCSGADRFDGRTYHGEKSSFRVGPVPASWRRITIEGALFAFDDPDSGGSVEVFARCRQREDDVPLASHTQHLLIGFTAREVTSEDPLQLDGRDALRTVVTAKLDGVPVSLGIYVVKKNECVYEMVYAAPPREFAAGIAGFDGFARGFSTLTAGEEGRSR